MERPARGDVWCGDRGRRRLRVAVDEARSWRDLRGRARRELREEATELAEEAVALLLERGRHARAVVVQGEPVAAIVKVFEDEDADVVVVGRRGLAAELSGLPGAVERIRGRLIGSVAERLVQVESVPTLVVG